MSLIWRVNYMNFPEKWKAVSDVPPSTHFESNDTVVLAFEPKSQREHGSKSGGLSRHYSTSRPHDKRQKATELYSAAYPLTSTTSLQYNMNTSLVISPTADDDPLGILKVSGFYGPGAWLGWVLTFVTSCYNLHRKPKTRRLQDTIVFLLETNWAALDLLHRTSTALKVPIRDLDGTQGSIAAAFLVTFWGLFCIIAQLIVYFYWCSDEFALLPRRFNILLIGAALPSVAIANLFRLSGPFMNVAEPTNRRDWIWSIPALYVTEFRAGDQLPLVCVAVTLGLFSFIFLCVFLLWRLNDMVRNKKGFFHSRRMEFWYVVTMALYLIGPIFTILAVRGRDVSYYIIGLCASHIVFACYVLPAFPVSAAMYGRYSHRESCYFRPCAPQSVYEWDQAFALCVGLFILGLEIGPDVMKPIERIWTSFWTKDEESEAPLLELDIV